MKIVPILFAAGDF